MAAKTGSQMADSQSADPTPASKIKVNALPKPVKSSPAIKVRKTLRSLSDVKQKPTFRNLGKVMAPSEPVVAKEAIVRRAPSAIPVCRTQTITLPSESADATCRLRSCHQKMPFMVDRTATDRSSLHSRIAALQTVELTVAPASRDQHVLSSPCVAEHAHTLSFDERMQQRKASVEAKMEELYSCTTMSQSRTAGAFSRSMHLKQGK